MNHIVPIAAEIAEMHLAGNLPGRWAHVQAVAAAATRIAHLSDDPQTLIAAGWLHDIGYAPGVADTGLHSLDGARWLTRHGFPARISALIAHHSCAEYEAAERGLAGQLRAEFDREHSATADALWYADMITGPAGQLFTVDQRLTEIRARYGPEHLVTRFWARAEPEMLEAITRTCARLTTPAVNTSPG